MRNMKKQTVLNILTLFFVLISIRPLFAAEPWTLGLLFGLEGFNQSSSDVCESEYLRAGLYLDPFSPSTIRASLIMSALIPFNPFNAAMTRVGTGIELHFLDQKINDAIFFRNWRFSPSFHADVFLNPAELSSYFFMITLQPFRVWFSDSIFSFIGIELLLGADGRLKGYGVSLLRLISFIR